MISWRPIKPYCRSSGSGGRSWRRAVGIVAFGREVEFFYDRRILGFDAADQIGAERRLLQAATVEIPVSLVHAAGDAVILNVPTAALRELAPSGDLAAPH